MQVVMDQGPTGPVVLRIEPGTVRSVGSAPDCDLVLPPSAEPRHLELERTSDGQLLAKDLSGGRTQLNGRPLSGRVTVSPDDRLLAGDVALRIEATPMLVPGALVSDRYRVIAKLAAGGMGEVYSAEHVELGRRFALKVMKSELSRDADFVDRFRREAVASSRIGHPNIIDITDFGRTSDGLFFFAMELLEGQTLTELITTEGALPLRRARHLITQLCNGLQAAHALGIVHRDLKPENVMVLQRAGAADHVKILDFGIAKVSSKLAPGGTTAHGLIVGTPQYMSPEQAAGLPVDARSDIYSLGLIVYELLCGRPAFSGATPSLLIAKHVAEPPPPLSGTRDVLPASLRATVMRMLAKQADERPQSIAKVLVGLGADELSHSAATVRAQTPRPAPTGSGTAVAPVTEGDRPPSFAATAQSPRVEVRSPAPRWRLPLVVAVLLALVGAAVIVMTARRQPVPPVPVDSAPQPALAPPAPPAAVPAPAPAPPPEPAPTPAPEPVVTPKPAAPPRKRTAPAAAPPSKKDGDLKDVYADDGKLKEIP